LERCVRAGFPVAAAAAKYRSPVEGEIDAAVETDNAIILLESKAKAPTRVTMAGTSAEALLDYTGAVLESQVQALQHEILLRKDGMIFLIDRPRLYWRSRKVIRISVTLHDHGAMQDSLTVRSVTNALLNARFDPKPGYEKADRIQKLQKKNELLAQATERLTKLGVDPHAQKATCFSFSVVQLAVFLYESCNPDDFVARISSPLVFGTQNPLSDYVERIQRGMAPPARSP
jgi:hypothetical protein